MLGHLAGLRIDLADESRRRCPVYQMLPSFVRLQAVRSRARRRQRELLELLGCRIEAADRAGALRRVPHRSVRSQRAGSCGYAGLLGVIHSSIFTSTESEIAGSACSAVTEAAASTSNAKAFTRIMSSRCREDCSPGDSNA